LVTIVAKQFNYQIFCILDVPDMGTNLSQQMEQYSMADLMNKLSYIGHVVKDGI